MKSEKIKNPLNDLVNHSDVQKMFVKNVANQLFEIEFVYKYKFNEKDFVLPPGAILRETNKITIQK